MDMVFLMWNVVIWFVSTAPGNSNSILQAEDDSEYPYLFEHVRDDSDPLKSWGSGKQFEKAEREFSDRVLNFLRKAPKSMKEAIEAFFDSFPILSHNYQKYMVYIDQTEEGSELMNTISTAADSILDTETRATQNSGYQNNRELYTRLYVGLTSAKAATAFLGYFLLSGLRVGRHGGINNTRDEKMLRTASDTLSNRLDKFPTLFGIQIPSTGDLHVCESFVMKMKQFVSNRHPFFLRVVFLCGYEQWKAYQEEMTKDTQPRHSYINGAFSMMWRYQGMIILGKISELRAKIRQETDIVISMIWDESCSARLYPIFAYFGLYTSTDTSRKKFASALGLDPDLNGQIFAPYAKVFCPSIMSYFDIEQVKLVNRRVAMFIDIAHGRNPQTATEVRNVHESVRIEGAELNELYEECAEYYYMVTGIDVQGTRTQKTDNTERIKAAINRSGKPATSKSALLYPRIQELTGTNSDGDGKEENETKRRESHNDTKLSTKASAPYLPFGKLRE